VLCESICLSCARFKGVSLGTLYFPCIFIIMSDVHLTLFISVRLFHVDPEHYNHVQLEYALAGASHDLHSRGPHEQMHIA
jgi:hypothetical protein